MNGKGSTRRPRHVKHDEYAANWDRVFAKDCCARLGKCDCNAGPTHKVTISDAMAPFWRVERVKRDESPDPED
jgi:hypothetical protein